MRNLAEHASFRLGEYTVSPATLEVSGPDGNITLQRQVMRVLTRLSQEDGGVVARSTLFEECWAGRIVGEESLNRCVAAIRKSLGPSVAVITVAGIGYSLKTEETPRASGETVVSGPWTRANTETYLEGGPPSLAIMPLQGISNSKEDAAIGLGMTDDIVSALVNGTNLRVVAGDTIASHTATIDRELLSELEALDIRYIVVGSVGLSGNSLTTKIRLLQVSNAQVVWSERFEEPFEKLAAVQGDLVNKLAGVIDVKVSVTEMERALRKPDNLTAWEAAQRYMMAFRQIDAESTEMALQEARRAVALAPEYPLARACLSIAMAIRHLFLMDNDPDWIAEVHEHGDRALRLDDRDPEVLWRASQAFALVGDAEKALPWALKAVRRGPNNPMSHYVAGKAYGLLNETDKALGHYDEAETLLGDSFHLFWVHIWRINALVRGERYTQAEQAIDTLLALKPEYHGALFQKAILLQLREEHVAAQETMRKVLSMDLGDLGLRRTFRRTLAGSAAASAYQGALEILLQNQAP